MNLKNNKVDLSIAIPTYNEEKDIVDCLNSLCLQDYPRNNFEVIIVDNYSTDKTLDIAKNYSKVLDIKIIKNQIKDAEVSKMLAYRKARGRFFMYLDADMRLADKEFIKKMIYPLKIDKKIAGVFVKFVLHNKLNSLTRTLSYDEWQRDPIFKMFTKGIKEIKKERKKGYFLCYCDEKNIPPQGLMIYRKNLIKDYASEQKQLIDNEIPAVLVEKGYKKFAFVEDTGVYHLLIKNLRELGRKRVRNLTRTYYPNKSKRKFKWIDWRSDWPKAGIWLLYTLFIFAPITVSLWKTLKHRDLCFLNEPFINLVSTFSIIYGVMKNLK